MRGEKRWRFGRSEVYWTPRSEFNLALWLTSGDGEDSRGCKLVARMGPASLWLALPPIIRPHVRKVHASWDEATVLRLGRDWYADYTERRYGFYVFGNHFNLLYGMDGDDGPKRQRWSCFLPFADWRFVRFSLYGLNGEHVWTQHSDGGRRSWDEQHAQEAAVPKRVFAFRDFDGEAIEATTHIEEREWRFGTRSFRWLSLFRRPMVRRSLSIAFSRETGPRKGSWKGGTVGHSIQMRPGELHEAAFRRYCGENRMTFVGEVAR